ncbi:threonine-phosphate decarboxylase CobD [Amaricoccus tamworthensis]|uniref:threonine-phosphate decarboxylase CobD n=1 Tax=Amaricoccus tamworthensis TaxID=57002 RepID=UPI003C7CAC3F
MNTRDHGGNLEGAIARFGGARADWIDLSTGINRVPWPVSDLGREAWTALPTVTAREGLVAAARRAYGTGDGILPVAGAQAGIQLLPLILDGRRMAIAGPTYNEFAASFEARGWSVELSTEGLDGLRGVDVAVVVNPNNPDGAHCGADDLRALAGEVGTLVVDESFADAVPEGSLLRRPLPGNVLVLRSFGKFYGLAGVRLGFVVGAEARLEAMRVLAGPWNVSGPALALGAAALADEGWRAATVERLTGEMTRMDRIGAGAGWRVLGGTHLFRLFGTEDAAAAQERLAKAQVWSRIFPYSDSWIRLGFPGSQAEWERLEAALA